MTMIIDILIRNYDLLHLLALSLAHVGLLVCLFLLPNGRPLLTFKGDLQDCLFSIRLFLNNPPKQENERIVEMIDYSLDISEMNFCTRCARSLIVTGFAFSLALAVQGFLLITVNETVKELPLIVDAVLSMVLAIVFLCFAVFPLAICWSNRRSAASLRHLAGKVKYDYQIMVSENRQRAEEEKRKAPLFFDGHDTL